MWVNEGRNQWGQAVLLRKIGVDPDLTLLLFTVGSSSNVAPTLRALAARTCRRWLGCDGATSLNQAHAASFAGPGRR